MDSNGNLQGKAILVTGGAKRVGAAIARRLHAAGASLVLHYRSAAAEARSLAAELNAQRDGSAVCIQADLLQWHWPSAAFDVVAAIFIQFVGPAERDILFARLKDALKPGGLLLMQGYTPKQLEYRTGGPSAVENLYTAELLRTAFPGLDIVHLQEYEDVLDEGVGHKGQSALVGLVARKPAA